MIKQIIRNIEKCFECPFMEWDYDKYGNSYNYCGNNNSVGINNEDRIIKNINTIPNWCPLPDKKD